MGFERKRKVFKLKFADPEFDGLEVLAASPSMDTFVAIARHAGKNVDTEALDELLGHFCVSLISWNLEEDGVPVPATVEGLRTQEPDFVLEVVDAWMDAVNGTSANDPLAQPSDAGGQFQEALIPMETLSPSLAS